MIILYITELLESGVREILGEDWDCRSSSPDDPDWLRWEGVEAIVTQVELRPPLGEMRRVAPVIALSSTIRESYDGVTFLPLDCYAEELLAAADRAMGHQGAEGSPERVKLSGREREVLDLLAGEGWPTASQMASQLGVGRGYVYNICTRLYRKLGVQGAGPMKTRVAAVNRARELGLI